jgi:hypothetical protein
VREPQIFGGFVEARVTESEWLASDDPDAMLEFLEDWLSERKKRLFACACCRRVLHLIPDDRVRAALEVSEEFADRAASRKQLAQAYAIAWEVYEAAMSSGEPEEPFAEAIELACGEKLEDVAEVAQEARLDEALYEETTPKDRKFTVRERKAQAEILRDFFGNPFRPVTVARKWLVPGVVGLAQRIYQGRAFNEMPALADALEKADCTEDQLLQHCRKEKAHARGCWVLDRLLKRR